MRAAPPGILPVLSVDRASGKPLYRQIYEGYRDAVVERRLRAGQRLPSTRSLAVELGISRLAVLSAFEQLVAEGYFESRSGSGTFVARAVPDEALRPRAGSPRGDPAMRHGTRRVSSRAEAFGRRLPTPWWRGRGAFAIGEPPVDRFPARIWSRLAARHSRDGGRLLRGEGPMGLGALRVAVAEYVRTARAVRCEAEQVMIVGGSQQALDLAVRVLLDENDSAWIEEPGYFGVKSVLALAGAKAVPVPVDEEGIDVAAGIARSPKARAVFVTPSHQFPLGVTMSAGRRLQLLDWARDAGAWIVEDDYDSEYRYGNLPIASLQGLDRDARVVYVGTFTKILFPALRLGYIVLPPDLVPVFTRVRPTMDFYSPIFAQAVLADFLREEHFARHVRRMRIVCRERRAALAAALGRELGGELSVLGDEAGMYLTAELSERRDDRAIALRAADDGLWTAPLSEAYAGEPRRSGLILGYGGTPAERIDAAVARLRRALEAAAPDAPRRPRPGRRARMA
ncbi:MAG TPA: PLP-dependent aminotransferase family protein [Thermoanaerobaculia bacterium]|nr:PLP-dependent aminotransferase family protein [Thermoanaerobaculia bacterium]